MDLSDLLEAERIRCRCDIQSKKRALQTIAELLGESLRADALKATVNDAESADAKAAASASNGKTKKSRKSADKTASEPETLSDMAILDALISRERLGSTGLGQGVGLPHSRLSSIKEPIAAFVTLAEGVDYESADGQSVDLVLGLLVPEDCNDEHLKILAQLARRFSDEKLRSEMRTYAEPAKLYAHLLSLTPATE